VARASPAAVPRYGVVERTFRWNGAGAGNPWEDVRLDVTLVSPARRTVRIEGFYTGGSTWKFRFSPSRTGRWRWRAVIRQGGRRKAFSGAFHVVRGNSPGFVRPSPYNRFRWTFSDRSPYYPLGIGDCIQDGDGSGSPLDNWGLDGGFRTPGDNEGTTAGIDKYFSAYQAAGVNLFRWSVDNCSFALAQTIDPAGNRYLVQEGRWGDTLVRKLRQYGFRVYMVVFGSNVPFAQDPTGPQLAAVDRYVKYVVDRYGPYVDFWELMNEASASTAWYDQVAGYLRRIDPYHHPISTSYERPDLPVIDIDSPHWYESEAEGDSDAVTAQHFAGWKAAGKPVIVGEQGNAGQNWDPVSATRMRVRAWTAFFVEGSLIFWNSSFAKDYKNPTTANIYLGPEERGYLRVLTGFTTGFDPRARMASVSVSDTGAARGYALRGPRQYALYLHATSGQDSPTSGLTVRIDPATRGTAQWVSPATGDVLATRRVDSGAQTLEVPAFTTDVALRVRP